MFPSTSFSSLLLFFKFAVLSPILSSSLSSSTLFFIVIAFFLSLAPLCIRYVCMWWRTRLTCHAGEFSIQNYCTALSDSGGGWHITMETKALGWYWSWVPHGLVKVAYERCQTYLAPPPGVSVWGIGVFDLYMVLPPPCWWLPAEIPGPAIILVGKWMEWIVIYHAMSPTLWPLIYSMSLTSSLHICTANVAVFTIIILYLLPSMD